MMKIIPQPEQAVLYPGELTWNRNITVTGEFPVTRALVEQSVAKAADGKAWPITFLRDESLAKEAYHLEIITDGIRVTASTETGAFYAWMTMEQLRHNTDKIPCCWVADAPKYEYRGFMLDCARHFWTIDKIKQFLDVMASLKMNEFHWHLSEDQGWRAEIKKYPLLTEKGSIRSNTQLELKGYWKNKEKHDSVEYGRGLYYTQEQMREIVAYAAARHIEVVPEIDMPGHMVAAIACYPELSCTGEPTEVSNRWGVMDNICCCGKEDIYRFARDVIDEMVEIFPGRYFHIGGDEVPKKRWKTCPACQAKIKELGLKDENALQGYFNNEMAKYLRTKGKRMIGWNEVLDARAIMDRDVIAQWWVHHSVGDRNELGWLKDGGNCILSLVNYVYMDHSFAVRPLSKTYKFSHKVLGITNEKNVIGMEIPQWTEYIRDEEKLDMLTYPRLIAFAEVCWTPVDRRNYKDFEQRLEGMRDYFASLDAPICPQRIYRGKTLPWYKCSYAAKWKAWVDNAYQETEYMHDKLGVWLHPELKKK